MKKVMLLALILVLAAAVEVAAGVAQPTPEGQVLYDFEYPELASSTLTSSTIRVPNLGLPLASVWKSAPSVTQQHICADQTVSGAYSYHWTWDRVDWKKAVGMYFGTGHIEDFGKWANRTQLSMWVYNNGTATKFNVTLVDARGEKWYTSLSVDFIGWKQVVLPIEGFQQSPSSWQSKEATVNGVRDLPYTQIAIEPDSLGKGEVWIDLVEII